jgi:hypothetical protein
MRQFSYLSLLVMRRREKLQGGGKKRREKNSTGQGHIFLTISTEMDHILTG